MNRHRRKSGKRGALFAAALLTSSLMSALGGTDAKLTGEKAVIAKAPESNPLCFGDGTICFDVQERLRLEVRSDNFDFEDSINAVTDDTFLLQRFRIGVL